MAWSGCAGARRRRRLPLPPELVEELRGMADALSASGSPLTFDDLLVWNTMYDSWCFYRPSQPGGSQAAHILPGAVHDRLLELLRVGEIRRANGKLCSGRTSTGQSGSTRGSWKAACSSSAIPSNGLRARQRDTSGHARHRRWAQRGRDRDDDPLQPVDLRDHAGMRDRHSVPARPSERPHDRGRGEHLHRVSALHRHQLPRADHQGGIGQEP